MSPPVPAAITVFGTKDTRPAQRWLSPLATMGNDAEPPLAGMFQGSDLLEKRLADDGPSGGSDAIIQIRQR
jgi:hypothetical protein